MRGTGYGTNLGARAGGHGDGDAACRAPSGSDRGAPSAISVMLVHGYSITVYRSESGQTAACHDLAPPPGVAGLGAHACSDSPPLCSDSFKIYCSSVVLGVLRLEVARTLVRAGLDRPSPRRGGCDEAVARGAAQQRGGKHSAQHRGLSPPLVGARVRC